MTDDLVKRLRDVAGVIIGAQSQNLEEDYGLAREAADRIERLEKEVKRLEQQVKMASRLLCRSQPEYAPEIGVPHLKED